MHYEITNICEKQINEKKLKEIVNKKLYKIIEFMEYTTNCN